MEIEVESLAVVVADWQCLVEEAFAVALAEGDDLDADVVMEGDGLLQKDDMIQRGVRRV